MKKFFFLSLFLVTLAASAQDYEQSADMQNDQMMDDQSEDGIEYNHWSIEINGGLNKPSRPFTKGYFVPTFLPPENLSEWRAGGSVDLGLRYMINNKFGLKISGAYNSFKSTNGLPFETKYYYGLVEGVANFGNIFGFREWTQTLNFLVHGGAGPAHMQTGDMALYSDVGDNFAVFSLGFTPQVKLSDRLVLNADLSILGNVGMDLVWDGNTQTSVTPSSRGFNGLVTTAKIGFSIYLGDDEKHADWVTDAEIEGKNGRMDSLRNELEDIKNKMQDSDQDGVPDYLDREPNTMNGVAVDTKGIAVDRNSNGIPDEIESSLDKRYQKVSSNGAAGEAGDASEIARKLINEGYINVYFNFNSTQPTESSLSQLNFLKRYMKANPDASAELLGYADEIGSQEYNQRLSMNRAQRVKEILVSSGIDASRLSVTGKGSDASVDKSSKDARYMVRRVKFQLTK